jgi:hypothetical protein
MANVLRQNLEGLQSFIAGQGALKSLTFKKVTDAGNDEFDVDFEKGALRVSVGLNEAGKVAAMYLTPR